MKKYNGPSVRKVQTDTGKVPDSVGCCSPSGGGVIRKLSKADLKQQKRNLATLNLV